MDYGFFHEKINPSDKKADLVIAYSMGCLDGIKEAISSQCPIILFSPFEHFCKSDDRRKTRLITLQVKQMIKNLDDSPEKVLSEFYHNASKPSDNNFPTYPQLNISPLKSGLEKLINEDIGELLSELKTPALIIAGKQDSIVDFRKSEIISQKVLNSSLKLLESTGHAAIIDSIGECKKEIDGFIDKNGQPI